MVQEGQVVYFKHDGASFWMMINPEAWTKMRVGLPRGVFFVIPARLQGERDGDAWNNYTSWFSEKWPYKVPVISKAP